MLVELVPGYYPVVVHLVDKLERLGFGGARYAQGALQVDYTELTALRTLALGCIEVLQLHLVGLDRVLIMSADGYKKSGRHHHLR